MIFQRLRTYITKPNSKRPWHSRNWLMALIHLVFIRSALLKKNLHNTYGLLPDVQTGDQRYRDAEGAGNDLESPAVGTRRLPFGRNVPLQNLVQLKDRRLNEPNPREISRRLLRRKEFIPAKILNLHAAAWIQFMAHDWFFHVNSTTEHHEVPLPEDDDWHEDPMIVPATVSGSDPKHPGILTYANDFSHWWDGTQLYGNSREKCERLRSREGGHLKIGADGRLLEDEHLGVDLTGTQENYWAGLSLLHTLMTKEHNFICEELKRLHPAMQDEELFQRARLINTALMAKIHTVEWTPGILQTKVLDIAMKANWWGLLGRHIKKLFHTGNPILSGIVGSKRNYHGTEHTLTEEFVAVYRLHPLLPEELDLRSHRDDSALAVLPTGDAVNRQTRTAMAPYDLTDLMYSFGTVHPGALTLHNYPRFLQDLQMPPHHGGVRIDLATIDILRDRERQIPRYNALRRLIQLPELKSFDEINPDPNIAKELSEAYNGEIEAVDLLVGCLAEDGPLRRPPGFGFGETAFQIFVLMASRRLLTDRFFTSCYTKEYYTGWGLKYIDNTTMKDVIVRHHPELEKHIPRNAFHPWRRAQA